ncbi:MULTISPECIES: alpha/beta hydrolase [Methylosinus]|uniref:Alpha/beta hydrolase n=1 Tax=Methylosinus trichosporium (strain ATCC 35070 / NCIMB 11131 / UNIQEM 75 / OB3b) TaxID=595536 RepID=A0A2D2CUZ0_METT3|nr:MULTISPECIES: alpha/beta hydrolase [Methylosinus]ATQ66490.1 alpha/beta hydrolase [Methylosinus trichosporium OB3b]OBS52669.1 alpha/beta hydrolase [Methylosinus sp. 3S-1]
MLALKATAVLLVAAYLAATAALALFQRRLQYLPDSRHVTPIEAGLDGVDELRLSTEDGETLVAWAAPPREGRPFLLYFHGNAGALIDRIPRFRGFIERGYGFLAVAYRGYGGSTGAPTQDGLMRDADAAYRAALARGADARRLVLIGESLGSGVATALAATHESAALVLDSPFSSAVDVAEARYGLIPVRWLMADQFRSDLAIREVRVPLLIAHGDKDAVVPIALGRRLFDLANEPKSFILAPGAGHLVLGREEIYPRLFAWIDATLDATQTVER